MWTKEALKQEKYWKKYDKKNKKKKKNKEFIEAYGFIYYKKPGWSILKIEKAQQEFNKSYDGEKPDFIAKDDNNDFFGIEVFNLIDDKNDLTPNLERLPDYEQKKSEDDCYPCDNISRTIECRVTDKLMKYKKRYFHIPTCFVGYACKEYYLNFNRRIKRFNKIPLLREKVKAIYENVIGKQNYGIEIWIQAAGCNPEKLFP